MGNAKSKKPPKQRSALFESSSSHFTTEELKEMQIKFRGLAKRSDGPTVDQATFMKFMKFEDGLLGEQLFTFFDSKQNGVVDFEEFICGLAVFSRGTATQKLEVFFSCYDLNGDGAIAVEELATMLGHLPTPVLASLRLCKVARLRIPVADGGLKTTTPTTTASETPLSPTPIPTDTSPSDNNDNDNDDKHTQDPTPVTGATPLSISTTLPSSSNKHNHNIGVDGQIVDSTMLEAVQSHHSRIIEEMVKVAFENCDLNHDGKLSFAQFHVWAERNSDLMNWMAQGATSSHLATTPISRMNATDEGGDRSSDGGGGGGGGGGSKNNGDRRNSADSNASEGSGNGTTKAKRSLSDELTQPTHGRSSSQSNTGASEQQQPGFKVTFGTSNMNASTIGGNSGELGAVRFSGHLNKRGKRYKGWKKRHYRIIENFLYVFHKEKDATPSGAIFLDNVFVKIGNGNDPNQSNDKWPFVITSSGWVEGVEMTSKVLYASTSEIRDQWVKAIRDVTGIFEFEDLFEKGRTLGTGHFSTVYVAKRKSDQEVFAVKVINKTSLSEDEKELLRSEIAILKLVHHPNIIGTEQIMEGQKSINIVTELVRGGELFSHIAGRKTLSEEEAYTLFHPVISAVEYLHKMGIVHRDIKPENILCEEGFQNIKIADFGLGKLVRVAWGGGVVGWWWSSVCFLNKWSLVVVRADFSCL